MTIEIPIAISIVAAIFSIYSVVKSIKRSDSSEVEKKAVESATINVKLDQIGSDVRDIKYDITAVKKDVQSLTERMIIVEQSTKSAHKRLDSMEEREE